jgi:4-methyl-5(b-hydroxyethyl)-thiazole monophosphate biosynthesis
MVSSAVPVRVLALLAQGFEEIELVTPLDILRRAGVEVRTLSLTGERVVVGAHGIGVAADLLWEDFAQERTAGSPGPECVLLPGGQPGTDHLRSDARVLELVRHTVARGRRVAAICAAPTVLAAAGVLGAHGYTCFPGVRYALLGAGCPNYREAAVVTDGLLTTSRGAGTASDLGFALASLLATPETAAKLKQQMLFEPRPLA